MDFSFKKCDPTQIATTKETPDPTKLSAVIKSRPGELVSLQESSVEEGKRNLSPGGFQQTAALSNTEDPREAPGDDDDYYNEPDGEDGDPLPLDQAFERQPSSKAHVQKCPKCGERALEVLTNYCSCSSCFYSPDLVAKDMESMEAEADRRRRHKERREFVETLFSRKELLELQKLQMLKF